MRQGVIAGMHNSEPAKLAVSIEEAARLLSCSPRSIQNYVALKILPSRKIGRRRLIPVRALEVFLRHDQPSPSPLRRGNTPDEQTAEIHA
jgi:excisionase family DNA binding protein